MLSEIYGCFRLNVSDLFVDNQASRSYWQAVCLHVRDDDDDDILSSSQAVNAVNLYSLWHVLLSNSFVSFDHHFVLIWTVLFVLMLFNQQFIVIVSSSGWAT